MAIGGGDGDRRKLVKERLMRGRKIDQMRGRKKELCAERERERERGRELRVSTERREKKCLKNYMHMLQYPCIFARVL